MTLLNIGASATTINIVRGDQSLFTRDVPVGGNAYTEALQKDFQIPQESAELLKRGIPADGLDPVQARPTMQMVTDSLLLEVQKTLDFFRGTTGSDHIDLLLVTGGVRTGRGSGAPPRTSASAFAVEAFEPFKSIRFEADKFGLPSVAEAMSTSAVAVGLALRRVGDR